MSLGSYMPPVSGETMGALLEVLSHPAEAKKVLEELAKERQAIENATKKQREQYERLEAEAKKTREENEKMRAEAEEKVTKAAIQFGAARNLAVDTERRKEEMQQTEQRLVTLRLMLEQRQEKMEQKEKQIEDRLQQAKEKDDQLHELDRLLKGREEALAIRQKALEDEIAENNRWLENLKPPRRR